MDFQSGTFSFRLATNREQAFDDTACAHKALVKAHVDGKHDSANGLKLRVIAQSKRDFLFFS